MWRDGRLVDAVDASSIRPCGTIPAAARGDKKPRVVGSLRRTVGAAKVLGSVSFVAEKISAWVDEIMDETVLCVEAGKLTRSREASKLSCLQENLGRRRVVGAGGPPRVEPVVVPETPTSAAPGLLLAEGRRGGQVIFS